MRDYPPESPSTAIQHILFLCVANSARSQMAEGLARDLFGNSVQFSSAGSQPTTLNPYAIDSLRELGIDIANQRSTSVDDVVSDEIDLVITLCAEEVCPIFLQDRPHLHWGLSDPDKKDPTLSAEANLVHFRAARDQILTWLQDFKHARQR